MIAIVLVFGMQAGFVLLQTGLTQSKNAVNVAQKNLAILFVAGLFFFGLGFGLMFGPSSFGIAGIWIDFATDAAAVDGSFFLFQLVLCATTAIIVAGAVAERMTFAACLATTAIIALCIYPLFGHWSWGAAYNQANTAWLASLGFIDFAGSTVVHSLGGWVALAGITVVGARAGRFAENGNVTHISGHSAVLATLGAFILWIGWIGFNGGLSDLSDGQLTKIVVNTMLAGLAGGAAGIVFGRLRDGAFRPNTSINGVLAGLVGVCAGCHVIGVHAALIIGATAAVVAIIAQHALLYRYKLDDVVGAVAVHGFAGAWGTFVLAFFADASMLATGTRLEQVLIQLLGVVVCFVWGFGSGFTAFKLIDRLIGLRVSLEDEKRGLNIAEHGVSLGTGELREQLAYAARSDRTVGIISEMDASNGDEAGEIVGVLQQIMRDRTVVEEQQRASEARFRDFATSTADMFWETDEHHRLVFTSASFVSLLNLSRDKIIGRPIFDFITPFDADGADSGTTLFGLRQPLRNVLFTVLNSADAEFGPTSKRFLRVNALAVHDHVQMFTGYRGTATDITDELAKQEEVSYLALHDDLTGLANRNNFYRTLDEILAQSSAAGDFVALVALDLDGFKDVNDTFGHDAGDALLKEISARIKSKVRSHDVAARLGGDEFAIIHWGPKTSLRSVRHAIARLTKEISLPVMYRGQTLRVSCSIGLACAPEDGRKPEELFKNADLALYEAKKDGKNRVQRVNETLRRSRNERRELEHDLSRAIGEDQLSIVFQPKICMRSGAIIGAEALSRWQHRTRGAVSADVFIGVAEEIGLILDLGNTVLRKACETARTWPANEAGPTTVAVNMSPAQLIHQDMPTILKQVLDDVGLPACHVELEITEHMLMKTESRTIGALQRLSDMGVKLSIDDFGTGHSSLAYLKQFPLDQLKIDKSFVDDVESHSARHIVQAIVQLAQGLELDLVAEGVESIEQAQILKSMGCQYAQGFLFFRPMTKEQFLSTMKAQADTDPVDL